MTLEELKETHPIAAKTEWGPLNVNKGSRHKIKELVAVSDHRFEFNTTQSANKRAVQSIIVGVIACIFSFLNALYHGLIFGVGAIVYGVWQQITNKGSIILDRNDDFVISEVSDQSTSLSSIVAFQIVSEELMHVGVGKVKGLRHVQSGRHRRINGVTTKNYTSFELNAILEDGTRYHLIDHANLTSIQRDGQTLSDWLNVPLLDASALT